MENDKKNLRQRLRNFWYYYKVHTITGLLIAALLAVLIAQCSSRVSPDYTVVLYRRTELREPIPNAWAA